jgi:hypothetical protein
MTTLARTLASVALATAVVASGSAIAVKQVGTDAARLPATHVRFVDGFSSNVGWNCIAKSSTRPGWIFEERWNGRWEPVRSDISQVPVAGCYDSWAFGYLNGATGKADRLAQRTE